MSTPNPNGANGSTSDPREQIMWDIYIANLTKGAVNAYDAAIEAGYSKDHSRNITLQGWFKERLAKLKRRDMLSKAERVLEKALDYETDYLDKETGEKRVKVDLLRVQTDVAKTIATTLGKEEGYSTKIEQEHSNPDGNLKTIIINKS
jgi:hypothetical protein